MTRMRNEIHNNLFYQHDSGRRNFLKTFLVSSLPVIMVPFPGLCYSTCNSKKKYQSGLDAPARMFDGHKCWAHPRAGIVPGAGKKGIPRVVMTMNTVDLDGSDVFRGMYGFYSNDLGKSWSEVEQIVPLSVRFENIDGVNRPVAASDFWPRWHKKSGKLLGTGHTVAYTPDWKVPSVRPRHTSWAVYDPENNRWSDWQKLKMPDDEMYYNCGAGCTQRVDLPDGTILLPLSLKIPGANSAVTVSSCRFDGETLTFLNHGDILTISDTSRGIGEPSLTCFKGEYYLTIRHDLRGYIARSTDGLHFSPLQPWKFDDGSDLGNYNTQQHWVTHSDGLYLVYTRRGAGNDHVFRHRAPLFMAEIDPVNLTVIRSSEQILVPNRGARLGNFGVTDISPDETWVTVAEWMQPRGVEQYGSDGSLYVARIRWKKPNHLFNFNGMEDH